MSATNQIEAKGAKKDFAETNQWHALNVSNEDWQQFISIMEAPIQTNQALKNAFKDLKNRLKK